MKARMISLALVAVLIAVMLPSSVFATPPLILQPHMGVETQPAGVMAASRSLLMSASPPRPVQPLFASFPWLRQKQQESSHFRHGEGDQVVVAAPFFSLATACIRVTAR